MGRDQTQLTLVQILGLNSSDQTFHLFPLYLLKSSFCCLKLADIRYRCCRHVWREQRHKYPAYSTWTQRLHVHWVSFSLMSPHNAQNSLRSIFVPAVLPPLFCLIFGGFFLVIGQNCSHSLSINYLFLCSGIKHGAALPRSLRGSRLIVLNLQPLVL